MKKNVSFGERPEGGYSKEECIRSPMDPTAERPKLRRSYSSPITSSRVTGGSGYSHQELQQIKGNNEEESYHHHSESASSFTFLNPKKQQRRSSIVNSAHGHGSAALLMTGNSTRLLSGTMRTTTNPKLSASALQTHNEALSTIQQVSAHASTSSSPRRNFTTTSAVPHASKEEESEDAFVQRVKSLREELYQHHHQPHHMKIEVGKVKVAEEISRLEEEHRKQSSPSSPLASSSCSTGNHTSSLESTGVSEAIAFREAEEGDISETEPSSASESENYEDDDEEEENSNKLNLAISGKRATEASALLVVAGPSQKSKSVTSYGAFAQQEEQDVDLAVTDKTAHKGKVGKVYGRKNNRRNKKKKKPLTTLQAFKKLVPLAIPAGVSSCLNYALSSTMPLAFVGTYHGEEVLAGASVGFFIISIVALYPLIGMTFGMDALLSQEYGRDPNSTYLGVLLLRGVIINLVCCIPVCLALFSAEGFLRPIYGKLTAKYAAEFLQYTPVFLCPVITFYALNKFVSNQMKPHVGTVAMVIGAIVTPISQISLADFGVKGCMWAMGIVGWTQVMVILVLIFFTKELRHTLGWPSVAESLQWEGVKEYVVIALHSSVFVTAEASAFDVTILLSEALGSAPGAAWTAIMNALLMFVSVAGGLSTAACAKVGACIGGNKPRAAQTYARAAVIGAALLAIVNSIIVLVAYDFILGLFGASEASLRNAAQIKWLVPIFHIADCAQFAFQGVFSGAGLNHIGARVLLVSLWGVGIPLAYYLPFYRDSGLIGVVGGLTLSVVVIELPLLIFTILRVDWNQLTADAADEQENEEEQARQETETRRLLLLLGGEGAC